MIVHKLYIPRPHGLHIRAAGKLSALAARFSSTITLHTESGSADSKDLMAILMLAANPGSPIRLCVKGQDEEEAATQLRALFHSNDCP